MEKLHKNGFPVEKEKRKSTKKEREKIPFLSVD